eukprot:jgi/Botrbrau1/9414/Bobra.0252s0039.1
MEMNNLFYNNLGIATVPPQILLNKLVNGVVRVENDDQASLFWVSNPNNIWINNAGIGGVFGFWFSLDFVIGGTSEELPGASSFFAPIYTPLGQFENNTAHSNSLAGVAMYRNGYRPIEFAYFRGITAYKNDYQGVQMHGSTQLVLIDSIVADSTQNVDFGAYQAEAVRNTILMGYSANLGNPFFCDTVYLCTPVGSCPLGFNFRSVPSRPGPGWRTVAPTSIYTFRLGVNLASNMASGVTYVNYDNQNCYPGGGAVGWDNRQGHFIPVASNVNTSSFVNTTVNRFGWTNAATNLPVTYVLFDADGTLNSTGVPTFLVANFTTAVLPPGTVNSTNCKFNSGWNAYACTGVCYRSVRLQFDQPGIYSNGVMPPISQIGFAIVTRSGDGAVQVVVQYFPPTPSFSSSAGAVTFPRTFLFNIVVGSNYFVTFGNMTGTPSKYWLSFADSDTFLVPGNSYVTPPGPPCTGIPALYLPTPVKAAATRSSTDGKSVSMLSMQPSEHGQEVVYPSASQVAAPSSIPLRASARRPAIFSAPAPRRGGPSTALSENGSGVRSNSGNLQYQNVLHPLAQQVPGTNRIAYLAAPARYAETPFGPPRNNTVSENEAEIPDAFGNITTRLSGLPSPPPFFAKVQLPIIG